jgi:hypothetical protein
MMMFTLGFIGAQGAAVFGTALLVLWLLKISHWFAKIAAMALSYIAWVSLTLCVYFGLGGDGGFMDGFMMVILLCLTALMSSGAYLLAWIITPLIIRKMAGPPAIQR